MGLNIDTGSLQQLVDGLFTYLEQRFSWFKGPLDFIRQEIDAELAALLGHLENKGLFSLTQADLKLWCDEFFAWAESQFSGNLVVWSVLKTANALLDEAGIPLLAEFLKSLGVLTD